MLEAPTCGRSWNGGAEVIDSRCERLLARAGVLHIAEPGCWAQHAGLAFYRPPGYRPPHVLDDTDARAPPGEGFIHCAWPAQLAATAARHFRGRAGLVLLLIDLEAVRHGLVVEDLYGHGAAFPHLYAALPMRAVIQTLHMDVTADGTVQLVDGGCRGNS